MSDEPPALRAWFHVVSAGLEPRAAEFYNALKAAGIHMEFLGTERAVGPGIVFFDELCDSVCEFILEISRHGRERVLAVGSTQQAVDAVGPWKLLAVGASDVLTLGDAAGDTSAAEGRLRRWAEVDQIVNSPLVRDNLVGHSPVWIRFLRRIVEVARFSDATVLLTGESGTGKEMAARLIHTLDPRRKKKALIILDCTTIVPELAGSEFFGHERGAFTGAVASREGAFELANGGTLFLDEVGELPLSLQGQLLRVIQEHTFKRVGGNDWRTSDFRLVCATNKDLAQEVRAGHFRGDLYYRIAAWTFHLPSLHQRREDILPLVRHFLKEHFEGRVPELDPAVRRHLEARQYPGNIRDLKQVATRMFHSYVGSGPITAGAIAPDDRPESRQDASVTCREALRAAVRHALTLGIGLKEIGRLAEDSVVRLVIEEEHGNLQQAARRLGVTDRALQLRQANHRMDGLVGERPEPATTSRGSDPSHPAAAPEPSHGSSSSVRSMPGR